MTPFWKGPFVDGLTQSLIGSFLQCPYSFYLKAILGLKDPNPPHPNLVWGDCFHVGLEHAIRHECLKKGVEEAFEYMEKTYDTEDIKSWYPITIRRMMGCYPLEQTLKYGPFETEVTFDSFIDIPGVDKPIRFRGKKDGVSPTTLLEHKCKGQIYPTQTTEETPFDLQVCLYLYKTEQRMVLYDLIRIPDFDSKYMPRKNKSESETQWVCRLFDSHLDFERGFPITKRRSQWVHQVALDTHPRKVEAVLERSLFPICQRVVRWWEHVTQPGFDPDDPKFYNDVFYKTPIRTFQPERTDKFKREFYDYLVGNMELYELESANSLYSELE